MSPRKAILLAAVLLPACFSLGSSEAPEARLYQVRLESGAWSRPPLPCSLAVRPFAAAGVLDREGILYRKDDVEVGYWVDRRWAESVAAMVHDAVQKDLAAAGVFRSVLLVEDVGLADYVLGGYVHRFDEEDRADAWYGVVEITFEVIRTRDGERVFHRRFREEERARERTVAEVVRALARALRRVLDEARAGIYRGCGGGGDPGAR